MGVLRFLFMKNKLIEKQQGKTEAGRNRNREGVGGLSSKV